MFPTITFDYYTISLLIGGVSALLSGFLVFLHNSRKPENISWLALTISTAIWSFGYLFMVISHSKALAHYSNIILHAAAILIPLFYFLFVLHFTKHFEDYKRSFWNLAILALLFEIVNPTPLFLNDVIPKGSFNFAPDAGPAYIYFALYFFFVVTYTLWIISHEYRKTSDSITRQKYKHIVFFTLAAVVGGGSVFLLTFNIMVMPYTLILFSIYPAISGYAILRYQLFDVRIVGAQLLTFGLWIFILARTLLAESRREQLANAILLSVTVVLGIFLIRSVLRQVIQRERIETLAKSLKDTNQKLARANERLTELDQLKSEFVSLATHQIRGPISAIKGYASLILEGDFGPVTGEVKDAVDKVFQSSKSLAEIVEDFLNISRIELGRMKFNFAPVDLSKMLRQILSELKPNIEGKGLNTELAIRDGVTTVADAVKIKQVFANLIDNAIKYTPKGTITVGLSCNEGKAVFSVKDNGVGISESTLPTLFQKFTRAANANETNISGTGLGLYVAKEMVKAHHGRIWAESEGEGKGSTFFVELDCK